MNGWAFLWVPFALACVNGGDDSNSKQPGALGGPCFANDTCNAGLSCTLENGSGVCEQPDATISDGPVDQAVAETGPTDAGSDASDACTQMPTPVEPCHKTCLDAGAGGCCLPQMACVPTAASCSGPVQPWVCQSSADCPNMQCCLLATVEGCPPHIVLDGGTPGAECKNSCPANELQVCMTSNDCTGGKQCIGSTIVNVPSPVGICQ